MFRLGDFYADSPEHDMGEYCLKEKRSLRGWNEVRNSAQRFTSGTVGRLPEWFKNVQNTGCKGASKSGNERELEVKKKEEETSCTLSGSATVEMLRDVRFLSNIFLTRGFHLVPLFSRYVFYIAIARIVANMYHKRSKMTEE